MSLINTFKHYSTFENCFDNVDNIFYKFKKYCYNYTNQEERYIFVPPKKADNKTILFVCHLDTVQKPVINKEDNQFYYGAGFDDRSGLYLMAQLFASNYDSDNISFLLCDNEEIGRSTAQFAQDTLLEYDIGLMIELDRAGNDYVFYDYYNKDLESILDTIGIVQGQGSYSDICMLGDLEICGINLGIGYTKAHSKKSVQSKVGLVNCLNTCSSIIDICKDKTYLNENSYPAEDYDFNDYDYSEYLNNDIALYNAAH